MGSPPRVRGKDDRRRMSASEQRITPACAGKRVIPDTHRPCIRDHPRVCGEKIRVASPRITQRGSPPRVRGKVAERCYTDCACGITPACAGKRTRRLQMRQDERDHPRVCGEKSSATGSALVLSGSPPRVRGKVVRLPLPAVGGRITPACAGKSTCLILFDTLLKDHPRVCGEKLVYNVLYYACKGSPPRVRGKAGQNGIFRPGGRITPACAGKSTCAE